MTTDLWDYESRFETTTRTGDGAFDQIIALSQGIINENFQKLYVMYSELHEVHFKEPGIGTLDGTLLAPQVLIPSGENASNYSRVLFLLRFASGYLQNSGGELDIPNLTGWTIAVSVEVVTEKLAITPDLSEAARKDREKKMEWVKQNFEIEEDYSIERLYAKLSSAHWNNFDRNNSYTGQRDSAGNPVSLETWAGTEENSAKARRLWFWLGEWAATQDKQGKNAMGISFKPKVEPSEATYPPVSMMHQVYPYKSAKQGVPNGATGLDGVYKNAANCNCLAYCEMVKDGGSAPKDNRLIWSGNLATQPRGPTDTGIRGTYLLNREIFLHKFLLPEFRALNRASDIVHEPLDFEIQPDGSSGAIILYGVGYDPQHPTDSDGAYDFHAEFDPLDKRKATSYRWHKVNRQGPMEKQQLSYNRNIWGRSWTEGTRTLSSYTLTARYLGFNADSELGKWTDDMTTDIIWSAGSADIFVKGTAISRENVRWTKPDSKKFDDPGCFFEDVYTCTWGIKLTLVPKSEAVPDTDGKSYRSFIDIDVDAGPNDSANASVSVEKKHHAVIMNSHDTNLEAYLKSRMADQIPRIIENVRKVMRTSGRFSYPGNGKLIFENPVIGKYGDLNAQIRYEALKPDEWIIVPKPEAKQGEQPVQHRTSAVVAKSARVQHALIWSAAPPIPSLTKNGLLHLRGTNSSENTIRFAAISASFVAGKRQACLFQNDSFKLKPSLIAEGDTKAIANTTSMNSASGTDVNESTDGTTSNEMMTPKGVGMTSDTKGHVDGKGLTGQTTSNVAGTTIETTGSMGDGKAATPQIPSVGANFTQDATSGTSTKPSVNAVPQEQFKVTGTPVAGARAQTSQATTAPFDEASKYDSAGLVELRPSPGSAPRKAVVHKLEAGKGTQKWEVEISAADGGTMAIKPGEWLELQITGDTGIAATQTMFIDEDYKDETSASDGHFGKPLNVIII